MEIKKSTLQNTGILIGMLLVGVIVFAVITSKPSNPVTATNSTAAADGKSQIISMTAKAGFTPNKFAAKANQNTTLKITTSNTFDCSSTVRIPSLGISKNLPASGNTEIAIAPQAPGTVINGTCGMGMYNFKIEFNS